MRKRKNHEKGVILVAGGAGYIGSHTNKLLDGQGYDTIVYDNLVYGHREFCKWGSFVQGDLSDTAQLRSLFEKHRISAVMHFAAFTNVGESTENPEKYYRNNVVNTLNLLNVMVEYGVPCLIFSSTAATYGIPRNVPIREDHPLDPINPYGRSKLMVERILEDYSSAYDLRYVSLRYFNAAGADPEAEVGEWHDPETHLVPLVLDAAIGRKEGVNIFGTDYDTDDGTCVRDYIHVTDLAAAHILALEHLKRGAKSGVFNLGNGTGFSVREVIEMARKVTGRDFEAIESDRRKGDPDILVSSSHRAKEALGWTPQLADLSRIIETAWIWHKKLHGATRE